MAGTRRLTELRDLTVPAVERAISGPVVVALSGGADSAAAAWAAVQTGCDVRSVHVDHSLPASDALATAAAAIAERLGIDHDVVSIAGNSSMNESALRTMRYEALTHELRPGEWLITGHTLDDQAETVLMNLVRGSGLDGLAGIPARRGRIVRPLLGVERSQTRELASIVGLPWIEDPTNLEVVALRNRVRQELLPSVDRAFLGDVRHTLARTAATARAETALLDEYAAAVPMQTTPGGLRLAAGHLSAIGPVLAARAIRMGLGRLGVGHPPTHSQMDRLVDLVGRRSGRVPVSADIVASRVGPWLELSVSAPSTIPGPIAVPVPGSVRWGRHRIDVSIGERPSVMPLSAMAFVAEAADRIPELTIGAASRSDRIAIRSGSKSVFDALAEAGVPVDERPRWPLVRIDGRPVWIPWVRRSGSPSGAGGRYLCAVATEDQPWEPFAP